MDAAAIIVLFALLVACVWGTFSKHFDDNLAQRVGMGFVGLGAVAEIVHICDAGDQVTRGELTIYIGVLCFVVGFVAKVWHYRPSRRAHYQRPRSVQ